MTPPDTTVNRVCRRHRFGPVELRMGPDDTVAIGPSGIAVRVALAVSPFPTRDAFRDALRGDGVEVEVDGTAAARLVQPRRGFRRRHRRVVVEPTPGSPLRPATFFRLRWWRRVTLETESRGLVARRFWPIDQHRPHTESDVDETEFLFFVAAAGPVRADLGVDVATRGG